MPQIDLAGLAILLIALGLGTFLVVRFGLKAISHFHPESPQTPVVSPGNFLENHNDGVLVVEEGGRIKAINPRARGFFGLQEGEAPNLERLARKVHPGEALIRLCAGEGRTRFILDGKFIEASSYQVSYYHPTEMMISLHQPERAGSLFETEDTTSLQTLKQLTQLAQSMGSNLDFEKTLQTIVENVEKLVPAEFIEITVWDAENDFFIPYRFTGLVNAERQTGLVRERYLLDEGIGAALIQRREPLLIGDRAARPDLKETLTHLPESLCSFLGGPLFVADEAVGALILGSTAPDAFQEEDLDLLTLFNAQAAIAIRNALLYRAEQKRTSELTGLSQLGQAFSSVRNPAVVFTRLVESIIPLIPVNILGFLIYNDSQRVLEAKTPFHGLPDQIADLFSVQIQAGSLAEKILLDQDLLITENASDDEKWALLGLTYIAQAASLRETVLVPLTTGGHMLGYLHASNHSAGATPFTRAEIHLLLIIANQAASIIENAALVQQSRQRVQRAEALRQITSLANSAVNLDEILQFALRELARLLRVDAAAVLLLGQDELKLHKSSIFGSPPELPYDLENIQVDNPQYPFTVTGSQHTLSFTSAPVAGQAIIPFYQAMIEHWNVGALIIVPLVMRNQGIGELWFARQAKTAFDQGDIQVVATAAGQLASMIEQYSLRGQTDESLRQKMDLLTITARINRELNASLDPHYLVNLIYGEALRITHADCGIVMLFDPEKNEDALPKLRFSVGDAPAARLSTYELRVLENGESEIVIDLQEAQLHQDIRSALAAPIIYQRQPLGLICLHSKQIDQFDTQKLEFIRSLAAQAAVALKNAVDYERQVDQASFLKRELDTNTRLLNVSRGLRSSSFMEQSLREIALAIQSATPFQVVLISVYDSDLQVLRRTVGAGISPEIWDELKAHPQPWQSLQQILRPEFKFGEAYFLPEGSLSMLPNDMHIVNVLPDSASDVETTWHQRDMLVLPVTDTQSNPVGLISVDAPANNRRPDRSIIEILEFFAAQASFVILSEQRVSRYERQINEIRLEGQRAKMAADQAQKSLPVLLHKDLENSIALRNLNQRMERVRATLDIAALATRQESSNDVLRTLASGMLTRFSMQFALIAEKTQFGMTLIDTLGSFPANVNPDALFGQRNPLRHLIQERACIPEASVLLISNLDNRNEWHNNTLLSALDTRSVIGLQLDVGNDCLAGVLVIGQRGLPTFLDEDHQVFARLAYQVSIGLQNLQLLTETRKRLKEVDMLLDFSRQLGSLNPAQILTSLIENVTQVLPNANSGWVGLWDEKEMAVVPQAAAGYISNQDILRIHYALQNRSGEIMDTRSVLPLRVFRTGQPERVSEVDFASQYHLSADDLLYYRRATNTRLPVSVMAIALQMGENVLGVLFLENFEVPDAFSEEDEALGSSFSRQATMALENARLYEASERRATQLQALTAVAGTITSSLQREELVSSLLDHLKSILPYDTATLWLRTGEQLRVAATTGFSDNDLRLNLAVAVEDSQLFKTMIQTGEPIVVGDLRNDPRFPVLVEPEYLSWLGIPLIYKSEVVGLIALEKREADFYTNDYTQAGTAFASQAAVSLENARLFEESIGRTLELDERSQRLGLLNRLSGGLAASLNITHILNLTGQQLHDALDAAGIIAVMIDARRKYILQYELPKRDDSIGMELPNNELFDHLQETKGIFQTDYIEGEAALRPLWEALLQSRQAYSLLVVPLVSGAVMQGWFLIYRNAEYRYSLPEIELARTICNQAALAAQNARLFAETRRLTEDLERRVEERTRELRREHQNSQTLLRIISELSASLDMGLVLNRTLNVLNNSLGCEESLIILSQGAGAHYRAGSQLAHLVDGMVGSASLERQIARWVVRSRQPVMVGRIQEDSRWDAQAGGQPAYQSVAAVALVMGEDVLGSLLLFHRDPDFFVMDQVHLLEATARQIAIALNNAELFNLIRDQSEHLGNMLRDQQIEASRSRAILEAVADGVLVTDAQSRVTLINMSAEHILSVTSSQMLNESLDNFKGLFGKAAAEWMMTIHNWSQNPSGYHNGQAYAERLEFDNGRIVAVHLAPVFWRDMFLGTVSIFRDITSEVQVDRLKSEFVTNVSHELRTPLTSIKGYVEILLMGASGALNPQQEQFLKVVRSNTERLNVLVNDLLDISQIETGRVSSVLQPINIPEIAEEVLCDLRKRSKDENHPMTFELDAQPALPCASGDPDRVRQVLFALATNGYNYTPDNGLVKIIIHQIGREIQVDVKDNGIGIVPEAHHRIFERFYRGEDSLVLATAGTGLGLAIAKTLVEMHEGRIWFESSGVKGEGSTFSFTLPLYEEAQDPDGL